MDEATIEKALKRFEIIAPLLNENLDASERRLIRREIMDKYQISERSLRRYVQYYKKEGYKSLTNAPRQDKGQARTIDPIVIEKAVELRRELPSRSVRRIIEILEGENIVKPGTVSRTSLNRHLIQNGVGAEQLRQEGKTTIQTHRRFQREDRNALWQTDIKYGPVLLNHGTKTKTYLIAFIDDATRMIMHAEFYDTQRLPILEDCFRKSLLKYGKPTDVYVDNGKVFVSKWFKVACARLGIRHITAKPYSPESKGKIEKYNQFVDQFLEELSLEPVQTVLELNKKFRVWLEEGYTNKLHASLNGLTPAQAYNQNAAKVKYISSLECRDCFLWEETRKVDKTGCIKLCGTEYDVGCDLIGKKVDVRYDPFDLSIIDVWYAGQSKKKAQPLNISEYVPKHEIPKLNSKTKPTHSRLLAVYEEKNQKRDKQKNGGLSFSQLAKENSSTVSSDNASPNSNITKGETGNV